MTRIGEGFIFVGIFLAAVTIIALAVKAFIYKKRLENEKYGNPFVVSFILKGETEYCNKFSHAILRAKNKDDARERTVAKLLKRAYLKSQIEITSIYESDNKESGDRYWTLGSEVRLPE